MSARDLVESSYSDPQQKARFLAAASPYSGDWLLVLPITACGLRLSDEAVRVAVALRLGCSVCVPHSCRCGSLVDAQGLHVLVCKQAPHWIIRHRALNDVVARAIQSAGTPITRNQWVWPDWTAKGQTALHWYHGKEANLWLGTSPWWAHWQLHIIMSSSARSAGASVDLAASRKEAKYTSLTNSYIFQPIAVESHSAFSASALSFLVTLGERLTGTSGDLRAKSYLFHCTAFQFGLNTRELCFCWWRTGPLAIPTFDFSFMFLALGIFNTEGEKKF